MTDMRKLIEAVLNEAVRYEDIFNPLQRAMDHDPYWEKEGKNDAAKAFIKSEFMDDLKWAKSTLRKSDRIVWYLKMSRIHLAEYAGVDGYYNELTAQYKKDTGYAWSYDRHFSRNQMMVSLEHYLTLPIPAIQNFQFRNQGITEVLSGFEDFEEEWKREASGSLDIQEGDEILIDFKNGWAWMKLSRAACSAEANAMGHCGNSPRKNTDDRILSLRKKVEDRWSPHLTFILNGEGELTEMKGRGNAKPTEKYHPMIIALLKLPIIKGVAGGGYLPQNNFSIGDLDYETRKKLEDEYPKLANAYGYYKKNGIDETFRTKLKHEYLATTGNSLDDIDGDKVVYKIYSFLSFIRMHSTSEVEKVVDIFDLDFEKSIPEIDDFYQFKEHFRVLLADEYRSDIENFLVDYTTPLGKLHQGITNLCERKARKYISEWIENIPIVGQIVSFKVEGTDVNIVSSAHDLAGALDAYSSGDRDNNGYWAIHEMIHKGLGNFAEVDDQYSEQETQEEFIENLQEQVYKALDKVAPRLFAKWKSSRPDE